MHLPRFPDVFSVLMNCQFCQSEQSSIPRRKKKSPYFRKSSENKGFFGLELLPRFELGTSSLPIIFQCIFSY